ncbi:MAG: hypothetical protein HYT29_00820 [Parcubacteria group bacterium]|nr:hypothetical protein [Parcubacteria group bacterium]
MRFSIKNRYFDAPLSRGFASLYVARSIVDIAGGLLGLFLPIFLYSLFEQNIFPVLLYYGLANVLYLVLVPYATKLLNRYGFRRALQTSVFFGALYFSLFAFIDTKNAIYILPVSLLVVLIYRLLYWVPYHVDFAKFTSRGDRGRELSLMEATVLLIAMAVPAIAGFIIVRYGFEALFFTSVLLYLLSGLAYLTIPHTNERFSWGYRETWKKFFTKWRSKVLLAYVADGAEGVVGLIVWPIFIFEILQGNYLAVGVVSALITAAAIFVQLTVGKAIDTRISKDWVLAWGSVFYALGWIFKIFIATAFEIFIAGAYHKITHIFTRTPVDAFTYEMSADEGHYVDEFTVLRELAINLGKTLMYILIAVMVLFFSLKWAFSLRQTRLPARRFNSRV